MLPKNFMQYRKLYATRYNNIVCTRWYHARTRTDCARIQSVNLTKTTERTNAQRISHFRPNTMPRCYGDYFVLAIIFFGSEIDPISLLITFSFFACWSDCDTLQKRLIEIWQDRSSRKSHSLDKSNEVLYFLDCGHDARPPLLKNNPAQFHPDPISNDRALAFLKSAAPRRTTTRRWKAIWDQFLIQKYAWI